MDHFSFPGIFLTGIVYSSSLLFIVPDHPNARHTHNVYAIQSNHSANVICIKSQPTGNKPKTLSLRQSSNTLFYRNEDLKLNKQNPYGLCIRTNVFNFLQNNTKLLEMFIRVHIGSTWGVPKARKAECNWALEQYESLRCNTLFIFPQEPNHLRIS